MISIKGISCLIAALVLAPSAAFAYGMAISSDQGTRITESNEIYETAVLSKVAEAISGLGISNDSRLEIVLSEEGKVLEASFVSPTPEQPIKDAVLAKLQGLTFGPVPGVSATTRLTLSFRYAELGSPPYQRNSISISSRGSILSGGNIRAFNDIHDNPESEIGVPPHPPKPYLREVEGTTDADSREIIRESIARLDVYLAQQKYQEALEQLNKIKVIVDNLPNGSRSLMRIDSQLAITVRKGDAVPMKSMEPVLVDIFQALETKIPGGVSRNTIAMMMPTPGHSNPSLSKIGDAIAATRKSRLNIDKTSDPKNLTSMVALAETRRDYSEALKLQKRVIEARQAAGITDKDLFVTDNLKFARLAISARQPAIAEKSFQSVLNSLDNGAIEFKSPNTPIDIADISNFFASYNLLDTADSGIRKAIALAFASVASQKSDAEIASSSGLRPTDAHRATLQGTILSHSVSSIVRTYKRQGAYGRAVSLQKFWIEKCSQGDQNTKGLLTKYQEQLASLLVANALNDPTNKSALMQESKRVFQQALDGLERSYGKDSVQYTRAIERRIEELDELGEVDTSNELRTLFK